METSLIESMMKAFVILDTATVPDGFGGYDEVLKEGAPFDAAATMKSTTDAQIAYQQGMKRIYAVVTKQTVKLKQGMKIKRVHDGLMLRVTSNADDMQTPSMSDLAFAQVSAEVIDP